MAVISTMVGLGCATVFKLFWGDETTTKRALIVLTGCAGIIFTATYLLKLVIR